MSKEYATPVIVDELRRNGFRLVFKSNGNDYRTLQVIDDCGRELSCDEYHGRTVDGREATRAVYLDWEKRADEFGFYGTPFATISHNGWGN